MKIRQCFVELQLKMSGMFFLRHTVQCATLWHSPYIASLIHIEYRSVTLTGSKLATRNNAVAVLIHVHEKITTDRMHRISISRLTLQQDQRKSQTSRLQR